MPTAPPRQCAFCGARAPGNGRCACGATETQASARARGYTWEWTTYARTFREAFPFCGQRADGSFSGEHSACARLGRRRLAALVDHIAPVLDGGDMWNPANHQSLCQPCHRAKTREESRRAARR
jgi:5-methylcytosine-specific restriction endonuclease McrA